MWQLDPRHQMMRRPFSPASRSRRLAPCSTACHHPDVRPSQPCQPPRRQQQRRRQWQVCRPRVHLWPRRPPLLPWPRLVHVHQSLRPPPGPPLQVCPCPRPQPRRRALHPPRPWSRHPRRCRVQRLHRRRPPRPPLPPRRASWCVARRCREAWWCRRLRHAGEARSARHPLPPLLPAVTTPTLTATGTATATATAMVMVMVMVMVMGMALGTSKGRRWRVQG